VCGITTRAALVTPGIFRPLLLLPVAIPPSLPCSKSLKTLHPVSALASGDPHPVGTHIILGCKLEPPRCPRCHVSRRGGSTLLQDAQKKSFQRPWNEVRTPHPSTARGKQTSPPDPDPLSLFRGLARRSCTPVLARRVRVGIGCCRGGEKTGGEGHGTGCRFQLQPSCTGSRAVGRQRARMDASAAASLTAPGWVL
jgi:hypothetical protein